MIFEFVLALLACAPTALCYERISPVPSDNHTVLRHGFQFTSPTYGKKRGLHGKSVEITLFKDSSVRGYDIEVSVGTPSQTLRVLFDTADNKVWIPAQGADGPNGLTHGTFDPSKSSTYHLSASGGLGVSYGAGSTSVRGDMVTDDFHIEDVDVGESRMGLASYATISKGNFGLAFGPGHSNGILNAMVAKGMIYTPAFSVYLNSLDAEKGSLLFGAIDTTKFAGQLRPLDMLPREGQSELSTFVLALTQFGISHENQTDSRDLNRSQGGVRAVLDTGCAYSVLPDEVANDMYAVLNATWDAVDKHASVPCTSRNLNGTFDFTLGGSKGTTIQVPFREMVIQNGEVCEVGVDKLSTANGLPVILGDTFLRSAYVVHDLANKQMALAQAVFDTNASHIVEFPELGATIPRLIGN